MHCFRRTVLRFKKAHLPLASTSSYSQHCQRQQVPGISWVLDAEQIYLDHGFNGARGWGQQQPWQQNAAMKAREAMLSMLDNLTWPHGTMSIHARSLNSGIQPQWMEAWWPRDVNEFAFIAEDDTEVSPFFYIYFKKLVMFYYYNQSNFDPSIYGISFQRQWLVPGECNGKLISMLDQTALLPRVLCPTFPSMHEILVLFLVLCMNAASLYCDVHLCRVLWQQDVSPRRAIPVPPDWDVGAVCVPHSLEGLPRLVRRQPLPTAERPQHRQNDHHQLLEEQGTTDC